MTISAVTPFLAGAPEALIRRDVPRADQLPHDPAQLVDPRLATDGRTQTAEQSERAPPKDDHGAGRRERDEDGGAGDDRAPDPRHQDGEEERLRHARDEALAQARAEAVAARAASAAGSGPRPPPLPYGAAPPAEPGRLFDLQA